MAAATRALGSGETMTRHDAQQRADQVASFRQELNELERSGVLALGFEERSRIERYHAELLTGLAQRFDVDASEGQRQMSLGMRIASLLGAVTLSAGVVLFFYRIWGLLDAPSQVAVLVAVPLLALVAVDIAARREKTLYVASVLALLSGVAFVLDLNVVGVIFNVPPTPWVLLPWAVFALAVAYAYGLRLMLVAGLALGAGLINALIAAATGIDWGASLLRPDPLVILGVLVFAGSFTRLARGREGFPAIWRLVGTVMLTLPLLFLSVWTEVFSYLLLPVGVLHALYDGAGFVVPVVAIWAGIRRRWAEVVNAATAFLVLFVYSKCFDWWWSLMPRYLFFLMLGGLAVGALALLGRLRSRLRQV